MMYVKLTLVTGGLGKGTAGGALACSGLKEDAIVETDLVAWILSFSVRLLKLVLLLRGITGMKVDL